MGMALHIEDDDEYIHYRESKNKEIEEMFKTMEEKRIREQFGISGPPNLNHSQMALFQLICQARSAWQLNSVKDMTVQETKAFQERYPGAHFVIGDFEIKCLNPDKYGL